MVTTEACPMAYWEIRNIVFKTGEVQEHINEAYRNCCSNVGCATLPTESY